MIKDFIVIILSDIIGRGLFFVYGVIVARSIPVEEFDIYSLAVSVSVWLFSISSIGIAAHGIRLVDPLTGAITSIPPN